MADGKFVISPQQLADHLVKIIPVPYKFVNITNTDSPLASFGNQYELNFIKSDEDEKNNNTGISKPRQVSYLPWLFFYPISFRLHL